MPIGSIPANSTKAGAIELVQLGSTIQVTTYYPFGDVFINPGDPGYQSPVAFELWYKFQPITREYVPNQGWRIVSGKISTDHDPEWFGMIGWNAGGNGVFPGLSYSPVVTVYAEDDTVIVSGPRVNFTSIKNQRKVYYIKVVTPPHPWIPECKINLFFTEITTSDFRIGTILVQDEYQNQPIAALPAGYGGYNDPRNAIMPETGHSVGGGAGDIILNGCTCILDIAAGGVSVRNKYHKQPVLVNIGTDIINIRRNGDGGNFWISYLEGGVTPRVRSLAVVPPTINDATKPVTVTLGPIIGITAIVDRLCARGSQILYYSVRGSYEVKRWNLVDNIPMSDLAAAPAEPTIFGAITDILVLENGDVMVGYNKQLNPPAPESNFTLRVYNGISGALVRDYYFNSHDIYNRVNYGEDSTAVYMWTHEKVGTSTFRKIRLSDGTVLWTTLTKEFQNGAALTNDDIYTIDGQPVTSQVFGGAARFNFFVSPVNTINAGMGVLGGGRPPDDEFYPPVITFPPYPFPPPELPPGYIPPTSPPIAELAGGGLVVLDPYNTVRHDVFLDKSGNPLHSPILVTIRTAYLGD